MASYFNTSRNIEIKWSPYSDEDFALVDSSILFYHIFSYDGSSKNRHETNLYLSDHSYAKLFGSIDSFPKPKNVAWYPGSDSDFFVFGLHELGEDQIKIVRLTNQSDNETMVSLDIESSRKSTKIEWSPLEKYNLAVSFEKLTDASSVFIWDATHATPIYKLDEFETCNSLCWHPQNRNQIYASSTYQYISLFDLRSSLKPVESISTDFIYDFSIDKKNGNYAASYENNKIAIWDLRKFSTGMPVMCIEEDEPVTKLDFCPSRSGRLGVLTEASSCVNVYRLEERNEILYTEAIQYAKNVKNSTLRLSTFSWHSMDSNKLMVKVNDKYSSKIFVDLLVADYSNIGFSGNDSIIVSNNESLGSFDLTGIQDENNLIDIGIRMKQRALQGYGVDKFSKNAELIPADSVGESDVRYMWEWFDLSESIIAELGKKDDPNKYVGVKSLISTQYKKYLDSSSPESFYIDDNLKKYIFKLCGWNDWEELVKKLEANGEYERAACICVFKNNLSKCIDILKTASTKSELNEYLALALAIHFIKNSKTTEHSSIKILNKLTNPYLKVLFSYLLDKDNFDYQTFNDNKILIPDRVCMAITMLKIDHLQNYINKLNADCVKHGNLYGILLTGLNSESLDLFLSYIQRTNDVQTVASAIINLDSFKTQKFADGWVKCYTELLDKWMLWEQRAAFDIKCSRSSGSMVGIRCGYCAENISSIKKTKGNIEYGCGMAMTCQNCSKPSRRCSVCSFYMMFGLPQSAYTERRDRIMYWFVFCQKCSHGGHLGHLQDWFKQNPECPAMFCKCKCFSAEDFIDTEF